MNYELTRYEKIRDHDGNITGIFIAITVDNGEEVYNYGYWLTPIEVDAVNADESAINDIVNKAAAAGAIAQDDFISTRPMPPIIEDVSGIVIEDTNVKGYLTEWMPKAPPIKIK